MIAQFIKTWREFLYFMENINAIVSKYFFTSSSKKVKRYGSAIVGE